jgi:hypothetical protein
VRALAEMRFRRQEHRRILTNGELDGGRLGRPTAGSGGDLRPLLDPRITREPAMLSIAHRAVGVSDKDGRTGERVTVSFDACRNRSARSRTPDHNYSHQVLLSLCFC